MQSRGDGIRAHSERPDPGCRVATAEMPGKKKREDWWGLRVCVVNLVGNRRGFATLTGMPEIHSSPWAQRQEGSHVSRHHSHHFPDL